MYPLLVACKSISNSRQAAAQEVVDIVRQHSDVLVDQAQLVSKELIRVEILWHETWHKALEEASRLYFGEHNIEGMLNVLEPLNERLKEGASTIKEHTFIQTIESLNLLKMRNTEFIVALNKVDRLCGWKMLKNKPIVKAMKQQYKDVQVEFNWRLTQLRAGIMDMI